MINPRLVLALALCATPVLAQDSSSSSSSVTAVPSETSSSAEPSQPSDLATGTPAPPVGLSDAELEMAVRAAYTAAASFASAHGNYFARDGVVAPLHDAVASAVIAAYSSVVVPADAFADL